ncbi:T9SS type A sorting domain-containing protein [bacterium]|nr:T9SS type A sorting domain-containing protein [bacterium]
MSKFYSLTLTMVFISLSASLAAEQAEVSADIFLSNLSPGNIMMVAGKKADDKIGLSVASGDINGDGFDDAIIGATEVSIGTKYKAGETYVIFGSNNMSSKTILDLAENPSGVLTIEGANEGDLLGSWVQAADMNNDGYDDLIIPAMQADPIGRNSAGKVYIIFGSAQISALSKINVSSYNGPMVVVSGEADGDNLGFLGSKGDLNGDGFEDAILKAYLADPLGRVDAGTTYVVFGSKDLPDHSDIDLVGTPDGVLKVFGIGSIDNYSDSAPWATGSGDLNGDGFDELLIGSRVADPDGMQGAGETYVIFGSSTISTVHEIDLRDPVTGMLRIPGAHSDDQAGNIVISGDVNHDGYDDVIISAIGSGKLYIVYGELNISSHEKIPLDPLVTAFTTVYGEGIGTSLCPSIGDMNGDSIDDIVMGAAWAGAGGALYIIFGSTDLHTVQHISVTDSRRDVIKIYTESPSEYVGFRTGCGDLNGDGFADAFTGAHMACPYGREYAGKAYIVWGRNKWVSQGNSESTSHFAFMANTGNNALVLIPSDRIPVVNGTPIGNGDEIGVFTPGGLCAGAGIWSGDNLAVTVWGDDGYAEGVNGFMVGELYRFKIWDVSEKKEYVVTPVFESGPETYQVDGISVLKSLETTVAQCTIQLSDGWNLVSFPVILNEKNVKKIFENVSDNVVCVKNGKGQAYLPSYAIDQIGECVISDGYQVFMKESGELVLSGWEVFTPDVAYNLTKNWNLISYVGSDGLNPSIAFSSLNDTKIIVKNGSGKVFWPEFAIDQIGTMHSGEGYWVYVQKPAVFTYSNAGEKQKSEFLAPAYFVPVENTGNNATILLRHDTNPVVNGQPLSTGDEIGVFSPDGICVGVGVWNENNNLAITVWGDNDQTTVKDGIIPGETCQFVFWDKSSGETYDVYTSFTSGNGTYNPNGISVIGIFAAGEITAVDESVNPKQFSLFQNYPNPFNPVTTITFSLPGECGISLKVYNAVGEEIAELADGYYSAGIHSLKWDAGQYASGIYFCRLIAGNNVDIKRMMLVK